MSSYVSASQGQQRNRFSYLVYAAALFIPVSATAQSWQLIWSDEFNGAANTSPSSQNWTMQTGGGGWGNQELETYSNSTQNVYQDGNGNLVIRAMQTAGGGYTSGRLTTAYTMAASYGKVEARIKVPFGDGIWPGFWMIGSDYTTIAWPDCGEIDIMEHVGSLPATIFSTIHGPGYTVGLGVSDTLTSGAFSDDYHIFGVVWAPNSIQFQVDEVTYATMTPASLPAGATWVFNQPFILLLNVAVGGTWAGYPDATTVFPQSMLVDYVRYYSQDASQSVTYLGQVLDAASATTNFAPGSLVAVSGIGLSADTNTNLLTSSLPTTFEATSVLVNNTPAALLSVSPTQILAQIPWTTPVGAPVNVQVMRNGLGSNTESITASATSPSVFLTNGVVAPWCLSGAPQSGTTCAMFGDGFGPLAVALQDGYPGPAAGDKLQATCRLQIGGVKANVSYCGIAAGQFINELIFVYPSGVSKTNPTVTAVLTITTGGAKPSTQTVSFQLPRPTK